MLRIAVIDDDKTLLCDMHKLFDRFIIAYDFDFTVEYFSSCEDIYAKFKAGEKYDLLFLDIEFPEMKGTEFGLQLRRQMKNYDTQIVFISTIRDYAMVNNIYYHRVFWILISTMMASSMIRITNF